jgi:hypothetical protein
MCFALLLISFFIWKLKAWWRWDSKFLKNPYIYDSCKCVCQISSFFYTLSGKVWLCLSILMSLLLMCKYSALVFTGLLARTLACLSLWHWFRSYSLYGRHQESKAVLGLIYSCSAISLPLLSSRVIPEICYIIWKVVIIKMWRVCGTVDRIFILSPYTCFSGSTEKPNQDF